ncbi:MAG: S9 family peptidase [Phycisphaerae bacterium]|nr:S9 family peptidase [Phycisphaerae bacterium]
MNDRSPAARIRMTPRCTLPTAVGLLASAWLALGGAMAAPSSAPATNADLIPRSVLFGNPERSSPTLSPDGSMVAFVAPYEGVMNVWVAPIGVKAQPGSKGLLSVVDAKPVTRSQDRPIMRYQWAHNGEQILYMKDRGGNENFHVYAVDLATGKDRNLTPGDSVRGGIVDADKQHPDEVLVSTNARDPQVFDVHRVNTRTGEQTTIFTNDGNWISMTPDASWVIRARQRMMPDGSTLIEARDGADSPWFTFATVPFEDAQSTGIMGYSKDGKTAYMMDARGRDTAGLFKVVPAAGGGKPELIFSNAKADVSDALINPDSREIEAVSSEYLHREWKILDPAIAKEFDALKKLDAGDFDVVDRTNDDSKWVVLYRQDVGPARWWLWDRTAGKGVFLGTARPSLEGMPLQPMKPVEITSRDGLVLPSYLTLPAPGAKNVPMVLDVHGGPWARDSWGYNPYHQWLANRGYAVLSVNFRGSTGFGKKFLNAGNREWFGKMQDDLNDAVAWAVKEGIADPKRVAIMGGSYGGYATLAALTRDPELFACGVDIVGPSHIATLLGSVPEYWKPIIAMFETRVGSLAEKDYLDKISPLTHVSRISRPLLIGQGANDPRVKIHESDQIVAAMKGHNLPVTYVVFPDEGHGFARPENNMAFNAVTEQFLAKHIGGRAEAVGDDVKKSSAQVRELGGLNLPGVTVWQPSAAPSSETPASGRPASGTPKSGSR